MCLIAVAHRASDRYPLVMAANRDEDHERPTLAADFWDDAPEVLGGRDALHRGSWLAISREGRFAAVTNLRGATPRQRSRGALVREFVTSRVAPVVYVEGVARDATEYAGFHLFAGEVGGELVHFSRAAALLAAGIHGVSNAPLEERWPKVDLAESAVRDALAARDVDAVVEELLRFLAGDGTNRTDGTNGADAQHHPSYRSHPSYSSYPSHPPPEESVFITGDRYGTRASTVIVATADEIVLAEQSYARGGVAVGAARVLRVSRGASAGRR